MEGDIVVCLRRFAEGLTGAGLPSPGPLMREAADEIERLRAEMRRHAGVCCGEASLTGSRPVIERAWQWRSSATDA